MVRCGHKCLKLCTHKIKHSLRFLCLSDSGCKTFRHLEDGLSWASFPLTAFKLPSQFDYRTRYHSHDVCIQITRFPLRQQVEDKDADSGCWFWATLVGLLTGRRTGPQAVSHYQISGMWIGQGQVGASYNIEHRRILSCVLCGGTAGTFSNQTTSEITRIPSIRKD